MTTTPLPPLPKARFLEWGKPATPAYTAAEMQAYATAARADLEAENADLRRKLEEARALLQGIVETAADMARTALEKQP